MQLRDVLEHVRGTFWTMSGRFWDSSGDVLEQLSAAVSSVEQFEAIWGVSERSGCVRAFPQPFAAAPGLLGAVQRNSLEPSGGTAGAGRGFCTFGPFGAA